MTAGFQSFTDTLDLQIDQDYKNLALITKATLTTDTLLYATSPYSSYKNITLPSVVNPVIALASSSACLLMDQNDTSMTVMCKGNTGTSFTYYIFGEPPSTPSAHGVGLQVLTDTGEVAYDSDYLYLTVLQEISSSASALAAGTGVVATSSAFPGRTIAFVQNSASFAQRTTGTGGQGTTPAVAYGAGGAIASSTLFIECFPVFGFGAAPGWSQDGPNGKFLVIDVTHF